VRREGVSLESSFHSLRCDGQLRRLACQRRPPLAARLLRVYGGTVSPTAGGLGGHLSAMRGAGSARREKAHTAAEAEARLMAVADNTRC
jgi:hypothetical protein